MPRKTKQKGSSSIFCANLQKVMKERSLSGRATAEIAGVAQSTFAQWLSGSQPNDLEAVHRLAVGLNVSFSWLLLGKEEAIPSRSLEDLYDIATEPDLSGFFLLEAKRLRPKQKK